MSNNSRLDELYKEYMLECHRMQSGVLFMMQQSDFCSPKNLRVGVNVALSGHGALIELLIEKGIFTEEEYVEKMLIFMKSEADNLAKELQGDSQTKVALI